MTKVVMTPEPERELMDNILLILWNGWTELPGREYRFQALITMEKIGLLKTLHYGVCLGRNYFQKKTV